MNKLLVSVFFPAVLLIILPPFGYGTPSPIVTPSAIPTATPTPFDYKTPSPSPTPLPITIYIPDDYSTIQSAIDAAFNGDTIIVRNGTYTGEGNREIDCLGKAITLRSENGSGTTILNGGGYRIFDFQNGETENTLIDGFTITGGAGNAGGPGGAIIVNNSSPRIINCVIFGNRSAPPSDAYGWNGGTYRGGAIYVGSSGSLILESCIIRNNTASGNYRSSVSIPGSATGGGIYCVGEVNLSHCQIYGNRAIGGSSWKVRFNGGSGHGGGIYGNAVISNCLIYNNIASGGTGWTGGGGNGGGVKGGVSIINSTICNNTAENGWNPVEGEPPGPNQSSGIDGSPQIINSIVFNNGISGSPDIIYSNIEGGWPGDGNIDADPGFTAPGDFRYGEVSPCIDQGSNIYVTEVTDYFGNPRIWDGDGDGTATVDMGAYEYGILWAPPTPSPTPYGYKTPPPSPTPSASPIPSPSPTSSPIPTPSPVPSPSPTSSPIPTPSPVPSPSPTSSPIPTPSASPYYQVVPFREDFEEPVEIGWNWTWEFWTTEHIARLHRWKPSYGGHNHEPPAPHGGNYNARYGPGVSVPSPAITRLVSPRLVFPPNSQSPRLIFWHAMRLWQGSDTLRILYRTSRGGEWHHLTTYSEETYDWTERTVLLPDAGAAYYICFEGTTTIPSSTYGICIDNVQVLPGPTPSATPLPSVTPTHSVTPAPSVTPSPSVVPTPSAAVTPTPLPSPYRLVVDGKDYNGDGRDDLAVWRNTDGKWLIDFGSPLTSEVFYFGKTDDLPASGDYDGDGLDESAVFRPATGLWAVQGVTRLYFGRPGDIPVPADYNGDGLTEPGIFRAAAGLWAVKGVTRVYFGTTGDLPVPVDLSGEGTARIGVFRPASGLWAIRGVTRVYFGTVGDYPVPAGYPGDGGLKLGIFRPASGLWAIRGVTRFYFGRSGDFPQAGDYAGTGTAGAAIHRPMSGLWVVRGLTRIYWGGGDFIPVSW